MLHFTFVEILRITANINSSYSNIHVFGAGLKHKQFETYCGVYEFKHAVLLYSWLRMFIRKCFRSHFSALLYKWTWQASGFDFPVETDKLHGPIWGMTQLVIRTHDQLLPPQTYSALCSEGVLINQIKLAENWHKNPVAVEVSLNWCPVILLFYSPSQSVRQIDTTNKHYHFWNRLQCQIQYLPSKTEHFGINSRIKLLTLIKKVIMNI